MKRLLELAIGLALLACLPVLAAGDAEAGRDKAAICAACHGADGNSVVSNWPKLAGQHAAYLERQLKLIRAGDRSVPEMGGIAAALSDQDIADLAAYFSSQAASAGLAEEALRDPGEKLYRAGNPKTSVPACMACHGPAGEGNPLAVYPSLAGQHAAYVEKILKGFRAGSLYGGDDTSSKIMAEVANRLSDEEIRAVASYIQGLHATR